MDNEQVAIRQARIAIAIGGRVSRKGVLYGAGRYIVGQNIAIEIVQAGRLACHINALIMQL